MLQIKKTKDYEIFKYHPQNRLISSKNINKRLLQSIQRKSLIEEMPIVCNMEMEVINGQNRLEICRLLGIDAYYVQSPRVDYDDIPWVQIQNAWDNPNHLKFYSYKNDYAYVREIVLKCKMQSNIPFIIGVFSNEKNRLKKFKEGEFAIPKRINKEEIKLKLLKVRDIRDQIKNCNIIKHVTNESLKAFFEIVSKKKYEHKFFLTKIKTHVQHVCDALKYKKCREISEHLTNFVYNFRTEESKKI